MAKYLLKHKFFDGRSLFEPGDVIEINGPAPSTAVRVDDDTPAAPQVAADEEEGEGDEGKVLSKSSLNSDAIKNPDSDTLSGMLKPKK